MRVLVVGASGTIGRPVCEELGRRRHDMIAASRSGSGIAVDIRSAESIRAMFEGCRSSGRVHLRCRFRCAGRF
jgi:uncharacterized protein YbjT (DUF2867 family)